MLPPAYQESLEASMKARGLAFGMRGTVFQPSEVQLITDQLRTERAIAPIRLGDQQPGKAGEALALGDGSALEQMPQERMQAAFHQHLLPCPAPQPPIRPLIMGAKQDDPTLSQASLILVDPRAQTASWAELSLSGDCVEGLLGSTSASVIVETFVEAGCLLPEHKADCFFLSEEAMATLPEFALAAIADIVIGLHAADCSWEQELQAYLPGPARPCRLFDFKRLVYLSTVEPCSLQGIVSVRRLPQRQQPDSRASSAPAESASSTTAAAAAAEEIEPRAADGNLQGPSGTLHQPLQSPSDSSAQPSQQGSESESAASSQDPASKATRKDEQKAATSKAVWDADMEKTLQLAQARQGGSKREARKRSEELLARELAEERNRQAWAKIGKEPPPPKPPKSAPFPRPKKAAGPPKEEVAAKPALAQASSSSSKPASDHPPQAQSSAVSLQQGSGAAQHANESASVMGLPIIRTEDGDRVLLPDTPSAESQPSSNGQSGKAVAHASSEEGSHAGGNETNQATADDKSGEKEAAAAEKARQQAAQKARDDEARQMHRREARAALSRGSKKPLHRRLREELLREEEEAARAAEARKDAKRRKQAQRRVKDQAKLQQSQPAQSLADASDPRLAPLSTPSSALEAGPTLPQPSLAGGMESVAIQLAAERAVLSAAYTAADPQLHSRDPVTPGAASSAAATASAAARSGSTSVSSATTEGIVSNAAAPAARLLPTPSCRTGDQSSTAS